MTDSTATTPIETAIEATNGTNSVAGSITGSEAENAKRQLAKAKAAPPAPPKRLSLADLRAAAVSRKISAQGGDDAEAQATN